MIEITGYDNNGKIVEVLSASDESLAVTNMSDGVHYLHGRFDYLATYILNGQATERPTSPVTRTGLTLLDVPEGSKLWINGESYDAAGTVELEFPLPGTYQLRVECFPFLDWTDEVTVPVVSPVLSGVEGGAEA